MEAIIWYMSLVLGTIGFLTGVFYILARKNHSQSDFIKATGIELLASWILYLPYEYYVDVTAENPVLHVIESILTAVFRTFNVLSIEGYEKIVYSGHEDFTSLFAIVRVLVSIAVALFAFGWIVFFFEGPVQRIRFFRRRKKMAYVFPEWNEKTASIARSIDTGNGRDANLIFLISEELPESAKAEISAMGGLVLSMTLTGILKNLGKSAPGIEVYLFGSSDKDNMTRLENAFDEGELQTCRLVRFFVELGQTSWALCDDYVSGKLGKNTDNVVVNFIHTEENFIYNLLWQHSFLKHVRKERDGVKKAKVLLAGVNDRSIEMFRAILHLSQMPGYYLDLTVLDEGANLAKLRSRMPELQFGKPYHRWGDAIYSIEYRENVDLDALSYDPSDEALSSFTYAYIHTGDDVRNLNVAMNLDALRQRALLSDSESGRVAEYEIMVNLSCISDENRLEGRFTNLDFSGTFTEVYSRGFITMSEFEKASRRIHEIRQKEKKAEKEKEGGNYKEKTWEEYCNSEYKRHSVYARTLSFRYRVALIRSEYSGDFEITKTREWKVSEHMRWNMFMRTIGYIGPDEDMLNRFDEERQQGRQALKALREKTRVHDDLIPFDALPVDEDKKDEVTITPAVLAVLEKK